MTQMWNEIMEQPEALRRCLAANESKLADLAAVIRQRKIDRVVIAARGTSDHAAVYGKYAIELLVGVPVSLASSSVYTIYKKSLRLENALVIGVSQSGRAADAQEVLAGARAAGALTVGITNFPDSPIAIASEYHLCCEAGLEKSVAATKTFMTQLMLLGSLAARWAGDEALQKQLATVPERLPGVFELAGQIERSVERYRFMQECFVLARGVNYAISLEAALKIMETTYVRAKAFATSDFQHGPIAMIDREIPAFVYAPSGPSLPDMLEMLGKLRESDVECVVVSDSPEALAFGACGFKIPETGNDLISPFFCVAVAQMFACGLALVKGLNPDSPRGLHKVTITR